ncbi:hypothetical protein [Sandarakinorhabdus sp.]|uniref:hypothetical protein n=1 Tax=Sandarakinorhabdus sp. TaxID=1916663 RepID=UPI003341E993
MARAVTSRREWAIAIGGGLAVAAALVWLLRGGGFGGDENIVQPAVTIAAAPQVPAPMAIPAATPPDLALAGVRTGPDGGMAIILLGGRQYLLRPGRSLPGGLKLLRVEPGRAILAGPGGEQALAFPDAPSVAAGPPRPPGGDPTPWLLATSPVRTAAGIGGWRLTSLAGLPQLASAGLQLGDILVAANGSELLSEEKIIELPQELAANGQLAFRVRRGNQLIDITVKP